MINNTENTFTGNLREDVKSRRFAALNSKMSPQLYFVLNDRFECEIDIDPKLLLPEEQLTFYYSSETWVEQNCKSRQTFMLDLIAHDTMTGRCEPAKWFISYDSDIDKYSSSLFFSKSADQTMFSIVKYEAKELENGKHLGFTSSKGSYYDSETTSKPSEEAQPDGTN